MLVNRVAGMNGRDAIDNASRSSTEPIPDRIRIPYAGRQVGTADRIPPQSDQELRFYTEFDEERHRQSSLSAEDLWKK